MYGTTELFAVVGGFGEFAGYITKHLTSGRKDALDRIVTDKPKWVYLRIGPGRKVLNFSVNIHALDAGRLKKQGRPDRPCSS
jgi:hypothetical protein